VAVVAPRWGLLILFVREPRAALVPRLPLGWLAAGLWPEEMSGVAVTDALREASRCAWCCDA